MIEIAVGKHFRENHEDKHKRDAKMDGTDMIQDLHSQFMTTRAN